MCHIHIIYYLFVFYSFAYQLGMCFLKDNDCFLWGPLYNYKYMRPMVSTCNTNYLDMFCSANVILQT